MSGQCSDEALYYNNVLMDLFVYEYVWEDSVGIIVQYSIVRAEHGNRVQGKPPCAPMSGFQSSSPYDGRNRLPWQVEESFS